MDVTKLRTVNTMGVCIRVQRDLKKLVCAVLNSTRLQTEMRMQTVGSLGHSSPSLSAPSVKQR